jgi:hypothetical protein
MCRAHYRNRGTPPRPHHEVRSLSPRRPRQARSTQAQRRAARPRSSRRHEEIQPTGRYPEKAKLIEAFKKRREETLRYVETTPDDLRSRFSKLGGGESDLYDFLLVIAGHTERHLKQMQEVMASPNFPK